MSRGIPIRTFVVVLALLATAACSSSSSSGTPGPGPTTSPASALNRPHVTTILDGVLKGLRSVTSIGPSVGLADAATALQAGSDQLQSSGEDLSAGLAGVPASITSSLSAGLLRISNLLGRASSCLATQATAKHPTTKPCLPPLRRAESQNGTLARKLISLSAFSTLSSKSFTQQLSNAISGQ